MENRISFDDANNWCPIINLTTEFSYSVDPVNVVTNQSLVLAYATEDFVNDVFIVFAKTGITKNVPVVEEQRHPRTTFSILSAYPNPFNNQLTIRYTLAISGNIFMNVFNTSGILIKTLVKEYQEQGVHEILWSTDEVASGMYFIQLNFEKESRTQKILLLK
jgi:hypothetical protein